DETLYLKYHEKVKNAYQAMRHTEKFALDTDRQAMLVRPLYMDLLDETDTAYARNRLIRALENYGWRLGTGFLSTPLILYVLSDFDLDAAYRLLENEDMPGWLFMPRMGATTIWESWEGTQAQGGIASLDHYSKGACLEWVFSRMCGVQIAGENRFLIAPQPGGSFTYAAFSYLSLYGRVSVRWERGQGGWNYEVTIPSGCTAEIRLPGREPMQMEAGSYSL
ncbi:MAG: alfa-L-rhamnosidase, partial [Clostridia bacterium]|nr:alfa-L-rhamnosidase [Clostridia bacterium]